MDAGAFFLILLVLLGAAAFIVWPFVKERRAKGVSNQEISTLLAERDRILNEIQELDFDHSLGKIPEAEYLAQRRSLLLAGGEVLRRLDNIHLSERATESAAQGHSGEQSGATIAEARSVEIPPETQLSDEEIEEMIAKRRLARKEKTGGFCSRCGKPFLQSDLFCAGCGQPVGQRS